MVTNRQVFFYQIYRSIEAFIRQTRQDHLPELSVTSEDSTICIQVRRKQIWKDSLRAFKQPRFTRRKWLKIEFVGESPIDDGGPRREYFCLGMHELCHNNALFQGALDKRIPVHNLHFLSSKEYREVGRFFAMSILQGGPAPQFLSPTIAHYLLFGDEGLQPEISEIPDSQVRVKVQKAHIHAQKYINHIRHSYNLYFKWFIVTCMHRWIFANSTLNISSLRT